VSARILIIDDDVPSRELAAYLLAAYGYDVRTASGGEDGLRLAGDRTPHLIICDLQMPGLDGYATLERLRQIPEIGAATPVIAVTASSMPEDRSKTRAAGFDGYLSKPITPETFAGDIAQFLPPALRAKPTG